MRPHLLFVCGRNRLRGPTAARIYEKDPRLHVRSAGVSSKSPHQISQADVEWADLILVMGPEYKAWILKHFRDLRLPPIRSLDIPDEFVYMDAELAEMIVSATEPYMPELQKEARQEKPSEDER